MRIIDEFGCQSGVLLRSKKIDDLIKKLCEGGIKIDPKQCDAEISYEGHKNYTVPLALVSSSNEENMHVLSYTLRNNRLKLTLKEHQEWHKGMPGMIGGWMIGGSYPLGRPYVKCDLEFNGGDLQEVERTKEIVREFY